MAPLRLGRHQAHTFLLRPRTSHPPPTRKKRCHPWIHSIWPGGAVVHAAVHRCAMHKPVRRGGKRPPRCVARTPSCSSCTESSLTSRRQRPRATSRHNTPAEKPQHRLSFEARRHASFAHHHGQKVGREVGGLCLLPSCRQGGRRLESRIEEKAGSRAPNRPPKAATPCAIAALSAIFKLKIEINK